ELGDPDLQTHGSPSRALGDAEVQAAGTQPTESEGMSAEGPGTVPALVRALDAAVHALTTERHEPCKPRGLRTDLWGPGGAIPPGYPARRTWRLRSGRHRRRVGGPWLRR